MVIDKRDISLFVMIMLLGVVVGCSDKEPLAPVTGQVFYNDKPLKFGAVMLQPPSGAPSTAVIQPDGSFELETPGNGVGSRIGVNKVRVTCFESQRPDVSGKSSGEQSLGKSLIPRRYNSYANGLTVEVKPSSNEPLEIRLTDD